jgi:hypothetical protein
VNHDPSLGSEYSVDSVAAPTQPPADEKQLKSSRQIAEEGFIYGLPLVMAYGAINSYSINRDSGTFTAPINEIYHEARVYTDIRPPM